MQNSGGCAPTQSVSNVRFGRTAVVLLPVALLTVWGCGGGYTPTLTPTTPSPQNAFVSGQYNLVLTSTNEQGTTNIYTNFSQTGNTFRGSPNTLVCPSNDLSQCIGGDAAVPSIIPTGTISVTDVSITISFPGTSGTRTVTMIGNVIGPSSGTYTDSLGDTGTWTANVSNPLNGNFSGTYNSTSHPLSINPAILFALVQDPSFHLAGTATIVNSPCISSLTLSGQAVGGAFTLTDEGNKAHIIAVPSGSNFNFSYNFSANAPSCAGDVGTGVVSNKAPWDY